MKTTTTLALGLAVLLAAGGLHAQSTSSTTYAQPTDTSAAAGTSIYDNPGVLGHGFADLNYSWVDFSEEDGLDANGFIAGINGNVPVSRGLDVGLGYNYYRENNHRNPFTGTDFDARYHQVAGNATYFVPMSGMKPFVSGGVGYQWSRGDIQSLSVYDSKWLWGASGGVELAFGRFAVTPRVSYTDTMHSEKFGSWHYGAEVHHWFTDRFGGYVDATYHNPRGPERFHSWTYTAGIRMRY